MVTKSEDLAGCRNPPLHPQPYTFNPAPSTLHPQPYTLNSKPNVKDRLAAASVAAAKADDV